MPETILNGIRVRCPVCKKTSVLDNIPERGYVEWKYGGKLIQQALPGLTADQREQLISGTCPSCWKAMFGS
jgi:hypothetical protein